MPEASRGMRDRRSDASARSLVAIRGEMPGRTPLIARALPILVCVAGLQLGVATPSASAAPCDPPVTSEIACENSKPGNPASEWDVSGAGDPQHPGLRDRHQRRPGRRRSASRSTRSRAATGSTSTGWASTAGSGARKVATVQPHAGPDPAAAGLPEPGGHRADRLRQLVRVGVVGRARRRGLGHLLREARARGRTGGASHIVFVVRDDDGSSELLFQTSDTTWQAYNHYGGNSLYTRLAGRARLQGQLQPPVHHARLRPRGLGLQRRVPDGALARAQRLRRQLHDRRRQPIGAAPSCSSTRRSSRSATTSTGRAASAPTSRRRAPPA